MAQNTTVSYLYQNNKIFVTSTNTTTVTNKDGSTTETKTLTTAAFSAAKNDVGKFLGAGTETKTTTVTNDGNSNTTTSNWNNIGYGQAAHTIGAGNLAQGVGYASMYASNNGDFFHQAAQDISHHPWGTAGVVIRSAGIAVMEVCPWCGRIMAIGGEAMAVADSAKDHTPYP